MKRKTIVLIVYGVLIFCSIVYTVVLAKFFLSSSESIAIPFAFIFSSTLLLFAASVIMGLVFIKHLKEVLPVILPVFLLTIWCPLYFFVNWYDGRPVKVPRGGKLPVSIQQYNADCEQVIADYWKNSVRKDSLNDVRDTIIDVKIDTIIYSVKQTEFFAIIEAIALHGKKRAYWSAYRVGKKVDNAWQLAEPAGNIWVAEFDSIPEFKSLVRQYYYEKYSINNSSDKPEIWTDTSIFSFKKNDSNHSTDINKQ